VTWLRSTPDSSTVQVTWSPTATTTASGAQRDHVTGDQVDPVAAQLSGLMRMSPHQLTLGFDEQQGIVTRRGVGKNAVTKGHLDR
jgi:hypothetical protein